MSVTLTEGAAEHILKTLAQRGKGVGLRFGVREQGCTGFAYVVDIAETIEPSDRVFEQFGVKLLIDEASLPIVEGTEIDYVTKGLNRSFEFKNPRAEHYCGCGESFSINKHETTETH